MDHAYIEENGLVERYYQGLLPPDEESHFEEHFVTCAACMEQLEMARGFQRGIKSMVAEDAVRAAVVAQVGLFAWLARRGRLAQWGLVLAVLLLAGAPSLWLAARSRSEQQAASREIEAGRQTQEDLKRRLAETEQRRNEERRDFEARLAQAQKPSVPPSVSVLDRPLANLAVVLLTAVRGEGEPATIDLSRTGDLLALAVDAGADSRFVSYRATITRKDGGTVYRQEELKPNALETLMITFPKTFFKPGDYRLTLEGVKADGGATEIGGYPFRVR